MTHILLIINIAGHDFDTFSLFLYMKTTYQNHLVGLVVKAVALRVADPGFDSHVLWGDFCGSNQTSDLHIGTPVATLLGA